MTEERLHPVCKRCGRKLKTEESKLLGYGKICFEKSRVKNENRLFVGGKDGKKKTPDRCSETAVQTGL